MTEEKEPSSLDPLSEAEMSEMLLQERQRLFAAEAAKSAAEERRGRKRGRPADDKDTREQLSLTRLLYESGKFARAEYLFHCAFFVEHLHSGRWLSGAYDRELQPISDAMTAIERAQGLQEDESFYRDDAPPEWLDLNRRYEVVLDEKFGEALAEFGLSDLVMLWRDDREQFDQLRESGRLATMEESHAEAAVANLVAVYERETQRASAGGAYLAAILMMAAAAEARILLHALKRPDAARAAVARLSGKLRPRSADPRSWSLEQLLAVAHSGGWLHNLPHQELVTAVAEWLGGLSATRSPLQRREPSLRLTQMLVGEREFETARNAYRAMRLSLNYASTAFDPGETLQ